MRQHDLRTKHNCNDGCGTPLVEMKLSDGDQLELSNISLSKMTPYQFVVCGESPYVRFICILSQTFASTVFLISQGYLFDRRHLKQGLDSQWGAVPRMGESVTTCVRRFGKPLSSEGSQRNRREHISGCRMSDENGHEVILCEFGGTRLWG